ncbi:MAG TPA: ubiquinol-cytochrome c reductase cytochrome b subunit, partial [Nocardioidaceae bacterium]|nr:ubiquinol-cytochrome c reductase cytochrome b subunit [Nocardioidaceae bacterium]
IGELEDENGVRRRGRRSERLRASVSRFFFEDRVEPVTPAELAAAHHGHEVEAHLEEDRPQLVQGQQ